MISVYRIYLGRSWVTSGQVAPLLSQFDDLPEFLHAVASLPETGPEIETRDPAFRRAAVKVAMTQCHAAIVWGSTDDPAPEWTEHEMRVAKWGFRRRIPLLAVLPPGCTAGSVVTRRVADGTVGFSGLEIARAVQELAEAATAERRSETDRLSSPFEAFPDPSMGDVLAQNSASTRATRRPLPTAEIMAAYRRLKAERPREPPDRGRK